MLSNPKKRIFIIFVVCSFVLFSYFLNKKEERVVKIDPGRGVLGIAEFGMTKQKILKNCNTVLYECEGFDSYCDCYDKVYGEARFDRFNRLSSIGYDFEKIQNKLNINLSVNINNILLSMKSQKKDLINDKKLQVREYVNGTYTDETNTMLFVFDHDNVLSGVTVYSDRLPYYK